jgi:hypothetical protein
LTVGDYNNFQKELEKLKKIASVNEPKIEVHITTDEEIKKAKELAQDVSKEDKTRKEIEKDAHKSIDEVILHAKKSFVEFLEGLLESTCVRIWFLILSYFILFCFMWFVSVSLYDMLYSYIPNQFFIKIWSNSIEFLKLLFAIIGAIFVFIKLFLNGKP